MRRPSNLIRVINAFSFREAEATMMHFNSDPPFRAAADADDTDIISYMRVGHNNRPWQDCRQIERKTMQSLVLNFHLY